MLCTCSVNPVASLLPIAVVSACCSWLAYARKLRQLRVLQVDLVDRGLGVGLVGVGARGAGARGFERRGLGADAGIVGRDLAAGDLLLRIGHPRWSRG